jgi:Group II intron, maturase-specific domain
VCCTAERIRPVSLQPTPFAVELQRSSNVSRSSVRTLRVLDAIGAGGMGEVYHSNKKTLLDQETVVAKLDRTMIGWANYFCLGPVSKAYRAVEKHACKRLRQWLCAKHKVEWPGTKRFPKASLHEVLASSAVPSGRAISRGRPREPFSERRMREIRTPGVMSGM